MTVILLVLLAVSVVLNIALVIVAWAMNRAAWRYREGWVGCLAGWGEAVAMIRDAATEAADTAEAVELAKAMSYGPRATLPGDHLPN